jgi:serine/threonine protein phosphatase 1
MVFKRLFGLKQNQPVRCWTIPAGQRVYAIGDIHGRLDLLIQILEKIEADDRARGPRDTKLIFLGDLVDRGPDSCGVVEKVMSLCADNPNVSCLVGNHEELLLLAYGGDRRAAGLFNRVGGRETMLSYGVSETDYQEADLETLSVLIKKHVPNDHIDFLRRCGDWVEAGDYLFVHAGIRPGNSLEEHETSDLRWIRREFTDHKGEHSHMIIHGHTITEEVDVPGNRIGIDTGAYATGRLTAIGLEGEERWFLETPPFLKPS